jgi:thioredoxin reductase (NADPH)
MAAPGILIVDADAAQGAQLEEQLETELADARISAATSVDGARRRLQRQQRRGIDVALLLVDSALPERDALLTEARELFPAVRRVVLTDEAGDAGLETLGTTAELRLPRPADGTAPAFLSALDDLLEDWRAAREPGGGLQVIGHRWSRRTHALRHFLSCNVLPYHSLDIENDSRAQRIAQQADAAPKDLPLVVLADGTVLKRPDERELAEAIGVSTEPQQRYYDLIIVGAGPAGLASAVYGASEGLSTVVLERHTPGGQAGTSAHIDNYLGFPAGLSGADLTRRAVDQAQRFGAELIETQDVGGIRASGAYRFVRLGSGEELACRALLLATGVSWRKLEVPGADALTGAGIYYGAARAEARRCADQQVFVVGGGNSAAQAALYLADFASRVTLLVRSAALEEGMSQYLVDQIGETETIDVRLNTQVTAVHGTAHLEAIELEDIETKRTEKLQATAMYLFIGAEPNTQWLKDTLKLDDDGYIVTGRDLLEGHRPPQQWPLEREPHMLEASIPGVFAAGDTRSGSVKRVASAVGEGGMAVQFVHQYLGEL